MFNDLKISESGKCLLTDRDSRSIMQTIEQAVEDSVVNKDDILKLC